MFLKKPDLTAGSRPTLSPDEQLLFVQDGVGLYEGSAGAYCYPSSANILAGNTRLRPAKKATPI